MPVRAYYSNAISNFLDESNDRIIGMLATEHHHALEQPQRWAWSQQLDILKESLAGRREGRIFLEFYIPRMGKRADAVLVAANRIFVIEFKVGATKHFSDAIDQVEDYALDLKNFHEGSHEVPIIPVLISSEASASVSWELNFAEDFVATPLATNKATFGRLLDNVCSVREFPYLDISEWMRKGYKPTPTIIEAAEYLYRTHGVSEISRSHADEGNLLDTSAAVGAIIDASRKNSRKTICFITGVPGSGKTLAGLNIATQRTEEHGDEHAVFLSGNGPLVDVLREALARDKSKREGVSKKAARREVRSFIQNIHHFRDEYVKNTEIPIDKVVVFDEAQRAWTRDQAASFMHKRGHTDFNMSEPEFLISVMDRHVDWCTIVCLVGGGQEINTGEAGIDEWIAALETRFSDWDVHVSPRIVLPEYGTKERIEQFLALPRVTKSEHLHLAVSMRSFRAEALSELVGQIVDNNPTAAQTTYENVRTEYPIILTRDLNAAKSWLRKRARGTERFGLVASSGALRLRSEGIHIKAEIEPINWFLNESTDVRSAYYLEEVASEFDVQGLELDWACVCWDADFRQVDNEWHSLAFRGTKWQSVNDPSKRLYLKNAYRVILTRARQGMIIFVPHGNASDPTCPPAFYDGTFRYLRSIGIPTLD